MKILVFVIMLVTASVIRAAGQVGISSDNSAPDPSAMFDVKSTTKGALIPRMTQTQIAAISNPANGLQVFCITDSKIYIYLSMVGQWKEVAYGTGVITPPFFCGIPVTVNHVAGAVAPVSKTVTYGTVSSIPGEPSKCWVTSNLGASQQASAVNDASEASAGWYWQFNRKQGYKHDGTNRTPNSAWITSIIENSTWTSANDPCTLQLGVSWRIPTYSEWNNVNSSGSWTNWIGPWNSALKLHAAGLLNNLSGALLTTRGVYGHYWSGTQNDNGSGMTLGFNSEGVYVDFFYKAYGYSIRCLR